MPDDLKANGRRRGPAKASAIELACRPTGWTQRAIGLYYGGISCAAVSVSRQKIRNCPAGQTKVIEQLQAKLTNEFSKVRS
jgi:hypothetical protein